MSWFAEPNRDALTVAPEAVASGPRSGFLRSFETAYEQQVRGAAMFGVQEAMRNREDKQRQALRDAGVENIPSISQQADDPLRMFTDFGNDYYDAAKFYQDGGDPEIGARLTAYDARVTELRKQFPQLDLETSREMWDRVREEAQKYEQRAATDRPDFGGMVGGFIGGAVGALNPNTDPLNFVTLPVGGAGKTIAGRIAGQGAAQGAIEGANQALGVQEQRRLLGLGYGPGDAVMRIGGAVVGGAAVQGAGEAIGVGFRKFFTGDPKVPDVSVPERAPLPAPAREGETPTTPATVASTFIERPQAYYDFINAVNPMRTTRAGKARMIDDLTFVEAHLDAWDGPAPWAIPPKTDTAPVRSLSDFTKQPSVDDIAFKADIDEFARVIDPETFAKYDKYVAQRKELSDLLSLRETTRDGDIFDFNIDGIKGDVTIGADPSGKLTVEGVYLTNDVTKPFEEAFNQLGPARIRKLLAAVREKFPDAKSISGERVGGARYGGEYNGVARESSYTELPLPKQSAARKALSELEPLIDRAYARARNAWANSEAERQAVKEMVRAGNKTVQPTTDSEAFVNRAIARQDITETIPVLQQRPQGMKSDADAADVQMRVYEERSKAAEESATVFQADAKRLLAQAEKLDEMTPEQKRAATMAREPGELPPDQFMVPGYKEPMSLNERIEIIDDETGDVSTITVRELLQQQADADEDLRAVSSCSLK